MLGAATHLGIAEAIDDVAFVVQRLVAVAEQVGKIAPELQRLLALITSFDESSKSSAGSTSAPPTSPRRWFPLTMIEVPGVGRVPVGQRLGVIPREEFEPGIHEYGKNAVFSERESRIASFLLGHHAGGALHAWADDRGTNQSKNPDCIRRPDADSPGILVEFKRLEAASANAVHQLIRNAARQVKGHGGGEVAVDGRDVGLSRLVAEAGCAQFLRNARHHDSYVPTRITIILPDDDYYEPRMS